MHCGLVLILFTGIFLIVSAFKNGECQLSYRGVLMTFVGGLDEERVATSVWSPALTCRLFPTLDGQSKPCVLSALIFSSCFCFSTVQ